MPTGNPKAGWQGVIYYSATAGTALSAMTLIGNNVRDVKIGGGGKNLFDATTRANAGTKGYIAGLTDVEVTIPVVYRKDEPFQAALLSAMQAGTPIAIAFLTDTKANTGEGWSGDWLIGGGNLDQPLDDGQVFEFTAKPWAGGTVAWVVAAAS